jgi:DNA modification methylase
MPQIKLIDIKVGERFRTAFEGIEELAASIQEYGLIEPIVCDEGNILIAGERRLRAHQLLKKETIEVKYMNELDDLQKREIELEENLHRKDFTWQEEVTAKAKLHGLKQKIHGAAVKGHDSKGWGIGDTATALGESAAKTSIDIALARGMKAFPELMKEKGKYAAIKKLKHLQEKVLQDELARRMKKVGIISNPNIHCGNCLVELEKIESGSIDLVLTDPPYGLDIENSQVFGREQKKDTRFEDGEFETFDLLDKVIPQLYRVLKDDRHLFLFCAIDKFSRVREMLIKHGFWAHHIPLIWDKGSGSYPSQSTTFVHSYEPFIHAMKGKRKLFGTPRDLFSIKRVPSDKKIHPTEKPTELLRTLIGLTTLAGEIVLDPFAGSGSTIASARELNRQSVGIELDPVYHENILKRLGEITEAVDTDLQEEEV